MFLRCITEDMAAILSSSLLGYLPKDVYLAGGTAVALYFGHRLSVDLDLFTPQDFDSFELSAIISEKLNSDFRVTKSKISENTLALYFNDTGFSLFTYKYPLLNTPVTADNIPTAIASPLDLSLMKLIAINQRGTCKDFIDLKTLIEANQYTFEWLMGKLSEKYPIGHEMHFQLKKSLVYFDDAEKDLNILMYSEPKKSFELLRQEDWKATSVFFERFVRSASI
jgi:predicted nucleotidyltransferase component of viral defense system